MNDKPEKLKIFSIEDDFYFFIIDFLPTTIFIYLLSFVIFYSPYYIK